MADADCEVTYTPEENCCNIPLAAGIEEPEPPVITPEPPVDEGPECPYYCGFGDPNGVQESVFDGADVIGGHYLQLDASPTSHPGWVKMTLGGLTGWRYWGGLGDPVLQSYNLGDNSVASGINSLAIGKDTLASGARAEAFGLGSQALGDDSKAWGVGAIARGTKSISIGNNDTVSPNDIGIGWDNLFAVAVAKPNIVIGTGNVINTALDPSATTPTVYGGHILIGYQAEVPYHQSNWHNIAIGYQAKSRGRANTIIGDLAQTRVSPTGGIGVGVFATVIGYSAIASGGCVVAIGDQSEVRGDNSVALGTHARANYHGTNAVGPNNFAGFANGTGGGGANAVGISNQALGQSSLAYGNNNVVRADGAQAFASGAFINTLFKSSLAFGSFPAINAPESIMFYDDGFNGGTRVRSIHFNGSLKPSIMITVDGKLQFMTDMLETDSTRVMPITSNITLDAVDTNLFVSTTSGNRVLTLPLSASVPIGKKYFIRRETAGANTLRVLPSGAETIEGDTNIDWLLTTQYQWALIRNDGIPGFEWNLIDWKLTP